MSDKSISKLIHYNTFLNIMGAIEQQLPGWWYSVSQKKNKIRLSLGPDTCCPDPRSRYLLSLKDDGYIFDIPFDNNDDILLETVYTHLRYVIKIKDECTNDKSGYIVSLDSSPRIHSKGHIVPFIDSYSKLSDLIKQLSDDALHDKYHVKEVYIGSCFRSTDCSLRGIAPDGEEFDISVDLPLEQNTISQSVLYAQSTLSFAYIQGVPLQKD
jgi:hypothetical protein